MGVLGGRWEGYLRLNNKHFLYNGLLEWILFQIRCLRFLNSLSLRRNSSPSQYLIDCHLRSKEGQNW